MEERSKEKKQCRFCRCPVVDGGVFLLDVDRDKLSLWWSTSLGAELNARTLKGAWCCQQCAWDARLVYEFGTLEPKPDYVWWPLEDPFYHKYLESDMKEIKEEPAGDLNERNLNGRNFLSVAASQFRKSKPQKKLKCTFRGCPILLKTESALKQHLLSVHNMTGDIAIKCKICKRVYRCKVSFANHMRLKHPEDKKYKNESHNKVIQARIRKATQQIQVPKTFDCFRCVEKFETKKKLADHIEKSHKNSTIRCKRGRYCNFFFKTKAEMEEHFAKKHQIKCKICPLVFKSQDILVKHIKKDHNKGAKKCGFFHCTFYAGSKEDMEKHVEESHDRGKTEKSAECIYCERRFVDIQCRSQHIRRLHAKIAIQCDKHNCLHFVKHPSELEEHKKEAHKKEEKQKKSTVCLYCNKELWDNATYTGHLKRYHSSEVIRCKHHTCFTFFKTKEDLEKHLKERHVSKFTCDFCGHGAARKDYMENHVSKYHLPKDRKCPECGKMFGGYSKLKGHILYHHKRSAKCPHCGENDTNLSRHVVTAECPVCRKSFPCKNLLSKHKLTCKTVYKCSFCDRKFKIESRLSRHLNDKHKFGAEWKGYKCQKCGKVFNALRKMQIHRVEAHPSFAKSCDLCEKKFWVLDALTCHLATAHKIGGFECEKCDKRFAKKFQLDSHLKYNHGKNDPRLQFIECDICKRAMKICSFREHLRNYH